MTTSPISKVPNETLLSIFDTMTSQMPDIQMYEVDIPLASVRASSQVCRNWRELLLASPSVWGRLIDLSEFCGPRRTEWMEEVIRRAGTAPLWVYGIADDANEGSELFNLRSVSHFIRLLESWERIERLCVTIISDDEKTINDIQHRFLCRAPMLKVFDVFFSTTPDNLFLHTLRYESSKSLFADHAPLLRTIKAGQVAYRLDVPWLSDIVEIDPLPPNLTLEEVFTLLRNTPVIETIGLDEPDLLWQQTHPSDKKLSLPQLSSIKLWTNFPSAARILDFILPGRLSRLYLNIDDPRTVELADPYIFSSMKANLPLYIINYFTANPSTAVLLEIMPTGGFRFRDVTNAIKHDEKLNFEVVIEGSFLSQPHDWDGIVTCLLDAFTVSLGSNPSILKSVTRITLPRLAAQPSIFPKLHSLLALFHHIQEIEIDERDGETLSTLFYLDEASDNARSVLFPKLHTVRLTPVLGKTNTLYVTNLTLFLTRRKNIGFPLVTLDMTDGPRVHYARDLSDLEVVDGLEVVWKQQGRETGENDEICTYICGTGNPELLIHTRS